MISIVLGQSVLDSFRSTIGSEWQGYYTYQGQHVTFTLSINKVRDDSVETLEGTFQDEGGAQFKLKGSNDFISFILIFIFKLEA